MYKQITKNSSWENISRVEYGTTSRANNLEKLNNRKNDGEIIVYKDSTNKQDKDNKNINSNSEIHIEINNAEIRQFISIELLESITTIKSAILHLHRIDDIKIFDNCNIYYGNNKNTNNLFLKGYIKNIIPTLNAENNSYTLQIKSYAGILVDSIVPQELEFINSNLKDIVEQVCSVYNIKISFNQNNISDKGIIEYKINNEIDNSTSAKLNETAWSFIIRLCNSRGLLVQDLGDGAIHIGSVDKNKNSKYSFILGETTIYNWLPIYNYDNLARYYEIYSQFNINSKELITLEAVKLPITKRIINNEINEGILQEYGKWIVCREIGKSIKVQIDININTNIDKDLKNLNIGNIVNVQNEAIGFEKETEMLIENKIVKYPHKITLILTLPCAYNGVIPKELPFI